MTISSHLTLASDMHRAHPALGPWASWYDWLARAREGAPVPLLIVLSAAPEYRERVEAWLAEGETAGAVQLALAGAS